MHTLTAVHWDAPKCSAQEMARRMPPLYGVAVYAAKQSEKIGWNRGNYLTPKV
ncbi:MAG: hypothetical protein IJF48_02250 [Clostridia bacterium]|nr:hypothetical protein [Clostridia bacterium]